MVIKNGRAANMQYSQWRVNWYFKRSAPPQVLQRWIGTQPAHRHWPYCQPLCAMLKKIVDEIFRQETLSFC